MVHPCHPPQKPLQVYVCPNFQWLHPISDHHSTNLDSFRNWTYNSRRLSVWKSCHESVVSRLLDRFLQVGQIKKIRGRSGISLALCSKHGHLVGPWLSCSSPLFHSANSTSASSQGYRSCLERMPRPFKEKTLQIKWNKLINTIFLIILCYLLTTIKFHLFKPTLFQEDRESSG